MLIRVTFPVRGMTLAADRESGHSPDHDRRNTPAVSGQGHTSRWFDQDAGS